MAADGGHVAFDPKRVALALNLLRGAHANIVFDTDEDRDLQQRVLAEVNDLVSRSEDGIARLCGDAYRPPKPAASSTEEATGDR